MLERGVGVDHTTLYRWIQQYAPEIEKRLRYYWKPTLGYSWRVDEAYVKVKGKWAYLYRAVDSQGHTIDFYLSSTRNAKAVKRFLGKALKISTKIHGSKHIFTCIIKANIGNMHRLLGNFTESKKVLEILEKNLRDVYGFSHINVAKIKINLSFLYASLGNKTKSKKYFEKAKDILTKWLREGHPDFKVLEKNSPKKKI